MWRDVMWCDVMWCEGYVRVMWGWCVVVWYDVMWCDLIWCDALWCDVMWFDVMWYDVMWYDAMWCDLIWGWCYLRVMWGWCYLVWYDVMWCDVMWCDVMWCDVMQGWCEGDVIWCDVRVMWSDVRVMWGWCDSTIIHAMIPHEIRWYKYPCYVNDISRSRLMRFFVVQVSLLYQWYLTKFVCEIFLGTNEACETSDTLNVQFALPCYTPQLYPIMTTLHLWSESEKTKTFWIARFLSQKLSG